MGNEIRHAGVKGMRWGYSYGSRNGHRTSLSYDPEFLEIRRQAANAVLGPHAKIVGSRVGNTNINSKPSGLRTSKKNNTVTVGRIDHAKQWLASKGRTASSVSKTFINKGQSFVDTITNKPKVRRGVVEKAIFGTTRW